MVKESLQTILPAHQVFCNEPMDKHTTFQVGGPADYFFEPASVDEIRSCILAVRDAGIPWRILGCGSNVLVSDQGIRGAIIHLGEGFSAIKVQGTTIVAQAGATNEAVASVACASSLTGYEFACGIPGSVGGAAIMNAGAYDGQFADVCTGVTCLTPEGEIVYVDAKTAAWSYRHSMMMDAGYVVLEVELSLKNGSKDAIAATMQDLQNRRAEKQPLELGSAGSTFKRPEGYYAGQLIQEAGMRGYTVGGAQVSEKHCGFVVNKGNATAADVLAVINDVQDAVFKHAGVRLEPEVRIWE